MSRCTWCEKRCDTLFACAKCKQTLYCGKTCQIGHWYEGHKKECGNKKIGVDGPTMVIPTTFQPLKSTKTTEPLFLDRIEDRISDFESKLNKLKSTPKNIQKFKQLAVETLEDIRIDSTAFIESDLFDVDLLVNDARDRVQDKIKELQKIILDTEDDETREKLFEDLKTLRTEKFNITPQLMNGQIQQLSGELSNNLLDLSATLKQKENGFTLFGAKKRYTDADILEEAGYFDIATSLVWDHVKDDGSGFDIDKLLDTVIEVHAIRKKEGVPLRVDNVRGDLVKRIFSNNINIQKISDKIEESEEINNEDIEDIEKSFFESLMVMLERDDIESAFSKINELLPPIIKDIAERALERIMGLLTAKEGGSFDKDRKVLVENIRSKIQYIELLRQVLDQEYYEEPIEEDEEDIFFDAVSSFNGDVVIEEEPEEVFFEFDENKIGQEVLLLKKDLKDNMKKFIGSYAKHYKGSEDVNLTQQKNNVVEDMKEVDKGFDENKYETYKVYLRDLIFKKAKEIILNDLSLASYDPGDKENKRAKKNLSKLNLKIASLLFKKKQIKPVMFTLIEYKRVARDAINSKNFKYEFVANYKTMLEEHETTMHIIGALGLGIIVFAGLWAKNVWEKSSTANRLVKMEDTLKNNQESINDLNNLEDEVLPELQKSVEELKAQLDVVLESILLSRSERNETITYKEAINPYKEARNVLNFDEDDNTPMEIVLKDKKAQLKNIINKNVFELEKQKLEQQLKITEDLLTISSELTNIDTYIERIKNSDQDKQGIELMKIFTSQEKIKEETFELNSKLANGFLESRISEVDDEYEQDLFRDICEPVISKTYKEYSDMNQKEHQRYINRAQECFESAVDNYEKKEIIVDDLKDRINLYFDKLNDSYKNTAEFGDENHNVSEAHFVKINSFKKQISSIELDIALKEQKRDFYGENTEEYDNITKQISSLRESKSSTTSELNEYKTRIINKGSEMESETLEAFNNKINELEDVIIKNISDQHESNKQMRKVIDEMSSTIETLIKQSESLEKQLFSEEEQIVNVLKNFGDRLNALEEQMNTAKSIANEQTTVLESNTEQIKEEYMYQKYLYAGKTTLTILTENLSISLKDQFGLDDSALLPLSIAITGLFRIIGIGEIATMIESFNIIRKYAVEGTLINQTPENVEIVANLTGVATAYTEQAFVSMQGIRFALNFGSLAKKVPYLAVIIDLFGANVIRLVNKIINHLLDKIIEVLDGLAEKWSDKFPYSLTPMLKSVGLVFKGISKAGGLIGWAVSKIYGLYFNLAVGQYTGFIDFVGKGIFKTIRFISDSIPGSSTLKNLFATLLFVVSVFFFAWTAVYYFTAFLSNVGITILRLSLDYLIKKVISVGVSFAAFHFNPAKQSIAESMTRYFGSEKVSKVTWFVAGWLNNMFSGLISADVTNSMFLINNLGNVKPVQGLSFLENIFKGTTGSDRLRYGLITGLVTDIIYHKGVDPSSFGSNSYVSEVINDNSEENEVCSIVPRRSFKLRPSKLLLADRLEFQSLSTESEDVAVHIKGVSDTLKAEGWFFS